MASEHLQDFWPSLKAALGCLKMPIKDTKMSDWDIVKTECTLRLPLWHLVLYNNIQTEKPSFKIQFPMDYRRKGRMVTYSGNPTKRLVS